MKLKISTIFLLAAFVSLGLVGYSINEDVPNDVAPTVSENSTGSVQSDTVPPGGFPYPTRFNWNYSLIPGVNGGTVGACLINGNWIMNRWNNTSFYRYADNGPGGGPGTLTDSGTYVGAIRDMTINNGFLYGGQATGTIYKLNATTLATVTTHSTGGQYRAIAWDPNRKGYWGTNFSGNLQCFDSTGALRGTVTSALTGKYGMAWDSTGGVAALWVWNQGTGASELVKYNIGTGAIMNTWSFTAVSTEIAGGAEIMVQGGRYVLGLNYQNFALAGYDLGPAGPPPAPGTLCFNRTGVNLAIPDNTPAGVNDTIKVPNNSGTLDDITVVIDNITHTWIGDLTLRLSHGGETDTVISRIGTGTFGNSSDNLTNVRMTDSAAAPIAGIGNTINPSNGSWLPGGRSGVDSLKKHFVRTGIAAAKEMNGNWVMNFSDNAAGDTGRVNAWSICFYSGNITQIISNSSQTPDRYTLSQNYPNPFNPTTKINFSIPKAGLVSLKVYDMLGREVSSLVNRQLNAGTFTAEFDGAGLSSGTYFYRLQVNDFVEIKKMVLLK
jgi:subtilisin-like proprotein convertase family protein